MGLVHFLHGNPVPPVTDSNQITIECPNPKCERELSNFKVQNGNKVCPYCEQVLSTALIEKLGAKSEKKAENSEKKPETK